MDQTLLYCILVSILTGIVLYLYHFHIDPYKNIERHYFKTSKAEYCCFKIAYFVIFVSCVFSLRYLVFHGFSLISAKR